MSTVLWPSVSGAMAQASAVDTISNNLANTNTEGFKKDSTTFKEYLAYQERTPEPGDLKSGRILEKDFYPLDGQDQSFVLVQGTYTDLKPGTLKETGSPWQFAIEGPGFFEVLTPTGPKWMRTTSFTLNPKRELITPEGFKILGRTPSPEFKSTGGDPPPESRVLKLPENVYKPILTEQGDLKLEDGSTFAQIKTAQFDTNGILKKAGNRIFLSINEPIAVNNAAQVKFRQGFVEASNVNPVQEMTDLIKAHRNFEQNTKAIGVYNQLLEKETNVLGRY